jgi:hypothetical protein
VYNPTYTHLFLHVYNPIYTHLSIHVHNPLHTHLFLHVHNPIYTHLILHVYNPIYIYTPIFTPTPPGSAPDMYGFMILNYYVLYVVFMLCHVCEPLKTNKIFFFFLLQNLSNFTHKSIAIISQIINSLDVIFD